MLLNYCRTPGPGIFCWRDFTALLLGPSEAREYCIGGCCLFRGLQEADRR